MYEGESTRARDLSQSSQSHMSERMRDSAQRCSDTLSRSRKHTHTQAYVSDVCACVHRMRCLMLE